MQRQVNHWSISLSPLSYFITFIHHSVNYHNLSIFKSMQGLFETVFPNLSSSILSSCPSITQQGVSFTKCAQHSLDLHTKHLLFTVSTCNHLLCTQVG